MDEEMMRALASATLIACRTITSPGQAVLQASLDQTRAITARPGWERKAAAYAGFSHTSVLGTLTRPRSKWINTSEFFNS